MFGEYTPTLDAGYYVITSLAVLAALLARYSIFMDKKRDLSLFSKDREKPFIMGWVYTVFLTATPMIFALVLVFLPWAGHIGEYTATGTVERATQEFKPGYRGLSEGSYISISGVEESMYVFGDNLEHLVGEEVRLSCRESDETNPGGYTCTVESMDS